MFATVKTPELAERPVTRLKAWSSGVWLEYIAETALLRKLLGEDEVGKLDHARLIAWSVVDDKGDFVYKRPTAAEINHAADEGKLQSALAVYFELRDAPANWTNRVAVNASKFHGIDGNTAFELEKN